MKGSIGGMHVLHMMKTMTNLKTNPLFFSLFSLFLSCLSSLSSLSLQIVNFHNCRNKSCMSWVRKHLLRGHQVDTFDTFLIGSFWKYPVYGRRPSVLWLNWRPVSLPCVHKSWCCWTGVNWTTTMKYGTVRPCT